MTYHSADGSRMANLLTRKLEQYVRFADDERQRLDEIAGKRHKKYLAGEFIMCDGQKAGFVPLVLSGLAARSKLLASGRRQTMAFLIPGDLGGVETFVLDRMDHDILALTDTVCAHVAREEIVPLFAEMSSLTRALWWSTMTDSAVLRERIIDHGSRTATERICHILYELLIRYRVIGLAQDESFPFPITQEQLAEATGMTSVHVNRVIAELRAAGLVHWKDKVLSIRDWRRMKELARFEAAYLHLDRTAQRDPEVADRAGDLL